MTGFSPLTRGERIALPWVGVIQDDLARPAAAVEALVAGSNHRESLMRSALLRRCSLVS